MCTVTVRRICGHQSEQSARSNKQILIITMNRDEYRDRAAEVKPQVYDDKLYPLDSEAGGTWFGINQHGICLSLLNRYDKIDYIAKRSRGLLIPELLKQSSVSEIKAALTKIDLSDFAPFTLMINTVENTEIAQWTGQEFILEHPMVADCMHISSSSWNTEEVLLWRKKAFDKWLTTGAQHKGKLPAYNVYQPAGQAEYAPFMSRETTYTKSITQYHCENGQVNSRYWNAQALPNGEPSCLMMPLHTA